MRPPRAPAVILPGTLSSMNRPTAVLGSGAQLTNMAKKKRRPRPKLVPIQSAAKRRGTDRRWKRWFEDIKNQILQIVHRRHLSREVMAMIDANPRLKVPSAFYAWMRAAYINDMTMAISRLVDRDTRRLSRVGLIEEVADHPEVMTRRRFVAGSRGWLRDMGHRDFDQFAAPHAKRVHRTVIRAHRRELLAARGKTPKCCEQARGTQKHVPNASPPHLRGVGHMP
jgi:hypothetical protein